MSAKAPTITRRILGAPVALYRKIPRLNKKEFFKKHGKRAFWLWVTYQAVKGTLTTSLIWVPLILHTCSK